MARATQVLKVVVGTLFGATLGFYIEGEYHIYRKVLIMIDFFSPAQITLKEVQIKELKEIIERKKENLRKASEPTNPS